MKSPIKSPVVSKSFPLLAQLIPPGSVVNSFLFFDGKLEFNLANTDRFVIGHTNKYVIYEFWRCVLEEPGRVAEISEFIAPIQDQNTFHILQENWATYKDPFVRAALFFVLNRSSQSGFISAGKLDTQSYHPLSLSRLKSFKTKNFHIQLDNPNEDYLCGIAKAPKDDITLIPAGQFSYNFFEHGKNKGFEMSGVVHQELWETLQNKEGKWIALYQSHERIHELYKDFNIKMIDKFGKLTANKGVCTEMVIANF